MCLHVLGVLSRLGFSPFQESSTVPGHNRRRLTDVEANGILAERREYVSGLPEEVAMQQPVRAISSRSGVSYCV